MSLISTSGFTINEIHQFLRAYRYVRTNARDLSESLHGKILATLFYEPSTRTRLSFESAMLRLGGQVVSESNIHFSSRAKWEDLSDTARVVSYFADIIALRSTQQWDALLLDTYASVPVINAGDGNGEHPTQALLDLATIYESFPDLFERTNLKVMIAGDLKYGRTTHSLSSLLSLLPNVELIFASPKELQIPDKYISPTTMLLDNLDGSALKEIDVLYMTRLQKERLPEHTNFDSAFSDFTLTTERAALLKEEAIILHPLPRLAEIPHEIDSFPQARYFDQVQTGVFMRMTILLRELAPDLFMRISQ
jgi:aspartate carbamoyltransferase catalytic subunit